MQLQKNPVVTVSQHLLSSDYLGREVRIDLYVPPHWQSVPNPGMLLINDGQDLAGMGFLQILKDLLEQNRIRPLVAVGIHCGQDRRNEYGVIASPDYLGRGAKAPQYRDFIFSELLPFIHQHFSGKAFSDRVFAGFSLGGLSALDLVWQNPAVFSAAAVFSGSLWWRSKDPADRDYDEWQHRIMHRQIRQDSIRPGLRFFFECGEADETADRNHNGVIDSIDDTIDLMRLLLKKGYLEGNDFAYLQLAQGRHDIATWGRAFPAFLEWYYGQA